LINLQRNAKIEAEVYAYLCSCVKNQVILPASAHSSQWVLFNV